MYEQDYHYLIQDAPKMNKYINLGYNDEKAITFHVSGECLSQYIYTKSNGSPPKFSLTSPYFSGRKKLSLTEILL